MNYNRAYKLLKKIGFVRTGGSKEELLAANILLEEITSMGGKATLDPFEIQSQTVKKQKLTLLSPDQKDYEVSAYGCCGSTAEEGITAPFYYMECANEVDKSLAKGKIVLVNGYLGYALYKSICEAGALGFITYSGDVCRDNLNNSDLDIRELRATLHGPLGKIPGVHMRAIDALDLVKRNPKTIRLIVIQEEHISTSQNVVAKIEGDNSDEIIVFTAHYDSVPFSSGVYDNGAGSVILMELFRHFSINKPRRTLKFIWCGSEERGLQGSKHYVNTNEEELKAVRLCINVDVGAAVLGRELAIVTAELALKHYIDYLSKEVGVAIESSFDIYSSDSIPFADKGIPGINFARFAAAGGGHIHDRYDTLKFLDAKSLEKTGNLALLFANKVINAVVFPISKTIPDELVKKIDKYLNK